MARKLFVPAKKFSATINPTSVANATAANQTFTVSGLTTDMDIVGICMPSLEAGVTISNAFVSATNTLSIRFSNNTAAPIDPASQTVRFSVV